MDTDGHGIIWAKKQCPSVAIRAKKKKKYESNDKRGTGV